MHLAKVYLHCSLKIIQYSTVDGPLLFRHSDFPMGLNVQCRPFLQDSQAIPMDFHVLRFDSSVTVRKATERSILSGLDWFWIVDKCSWKM